jgi:hypothetical protein
MNAALIVMTRSFVFLQLSAILYFVLLHYVGHEDAIKHTAFFYTITWCYQAMLMPRLFLGLVILAAIFALAAYLRTTLGFPDGIVLAFIIITSICTVVTVILLISAHVVNYRESKKEKEGA